MLEPDQWDPIRTERILTQREEEYKRETRLRRSREFWQDVGLNAGDAGDSEIPDDDPLAALPEAEEFWTEEVAIPPTPDEAPLIEDQAPGEPIESVESEPATEDAPLADVPPGEAAKEEPPDEPTEEDGDSTEGEQLNLFS